MSQYQGIMLWAEAVKKAGSLDREKLIKTLEAGVSIEGPAGTVKMDGKTHHAIARHQGDGGQGPEADDQAAFKARPPSDTAAVVQPREEPERQQAVRGDDLTWRGTAPVDYAAVVLLEILYMIAFLALISAGLAVVFGMMRVINLAHGEFVMIGGYTTIASIQAGIDIWFAMLVLSPLVVGIVGLDRRARRDPASVRPHDRHHARHLGL